MTTSQLSIQFNEYKSIMVFVDGPNSAWEQEVQLKNDETPQQAMKRYQKSLGEPYGWKTENGKHVRYLKSNAYVCRSWRWKK